MHTVCKKTFYKRKNNTQLKSTQKYVDIYIRENPNLNCRIRPSERLTPLDIIETLFMAPLKPLSSIVP